MCGRDEAYDERAVFSVVEVVREVSEGARTHRALALPAILRFVFFFFEGWVWGRRSVRCAADADSTDRSLCLGCVA